MKVLGGILAAAFALVALIGLGWVLEANDIAMFGFFAPKRAVIERKVFEETPSYVRGNIQELQLERRHYIDADDAHKAALRSVILAQADGINQDQLPPDLKAWLDDLRATRTEVKR